MTSAKLSRGNVVVVDFGPLAKTRPALVVQNDRDSARMTNTIVVQITINVARAHEATQHLLDLTHPDWKLPHCAGHPLSTARTLHSFVG